jgi:hypothetical protein
MSFHGNFRIVIGAAINIRELSSPNSAGARILSFINRPRGWKYGKGEQPSLTTVSAALAMAAHMMRLRAEKTGAFLTESGGIVVTGYFKNWTSEVLCVPGGAFELLVEKDGDEEERKSAADLNNAISVLTEQVQKWGEEKDFTEFFTLTTLTSIGADFKAGQFNERLETVRYLSSAYSALATTVGQSATTYVTNTQILPVSRQFTGGFPQMIYQLTPTSA